MRLPKLQDNDKEAIKLRSSGRLEGWENIKQVLYYQCLLYVLKVIRSELISRHYNDLFVDHFGIERLAS